VRANFHCVLATALLCAQPQVGVRGEPNPSDGRSPAQLEKFDAEIEIGVAELRAPRRAYGTPASLKWACKLSAKEVAIGDPLSVEVRVDNSTDDVSFRVPSPVRGFLAANLQVWVRADGDKLYRSSDGLKATNRKTPRVAPPVWVAPGETRRWTSRVDQYVGAMVGDDGAGKPKVFDVNWMGEALFPKAGKYEVIVRYVNPTDLPAGDDTDRSEPRGVHLFGPYPVTVTSRPKKEPSWATEVRQTWQIARPNGSDHIIRIPAEDTETIDRLTHKELRAVGPLGDDVILWRFTRDLGGISINNSTAARKLIDGIEQYAAGLAGHHPNRAAAEFLVVVARLQSGDEAAAVRQALTSSNPDIQLLVAEWMERSEQARKKVK
jgi:hypothetical protein